MAATERTGSQTLQFTQLDWLDNQRYNQILLTGEEVFLRTKIGNERFPRLNRQVRISEQYSTQLAIRSLKDEGLIVVNNQEVRLAQSAILLNPHPLDSRKMKFRAELAGLHTAGYENLVAQLADLANPSLFFTDWEREHLLKNLPQVEGYYFTNKPHTKDNNSEKVEPLNSGSERYKVTGKAGKSRRIIISLNSPVDEIVNSRAHFLYGASTLEKFLGLDDVLGSFVLEVSDDGDEIEPEPSLETLPVTSTEDKPQIFCLFLGGLTLTDFPEEETFVREQYLRTIVEMRAKKQPNIILVDGLGREPKECLANLRKLFNEVSPIKI